MNVRSVRFKVAAAIVGILFLSISASILISVSNQRTNLLEGKQIDLMSTNGVLVTGIRNVMLSGEAPIAVNLLDDLHGLPGFEEIEIYRRDGTIAFNDYATLEQVNSYQDRITFPRTDRLDLRSLQDEPFQRVLRTNTPVNTENLDDQFMEYYFPILNYRECRVCHGEDHFVRGVSYFRISLNDVFDRIGEARNTLILFYTATGLIIAFILITLMQRIVVSPILHLGGVVTRVGEGDLEAETNLRSRDELGLLSEKINSMITGLKDRRRLEIENSVIAAREQENRKYLDNINEGLLLLRKDLTISEQYSRFLITLFGTGDISDRYFPEFIYPNEEEQTQEREELSNFITMIFENTASDMDMIMSINPLDNATLRYDRPNGEKEIIIHADFQRILKDDEVESVMVIFQDRTDIERVREELEGERKRSKSDLEHIAALLKIGPDAYTDYDDEVRGVMRKVERALEQEPLGEERNALLRELHSLKGSSRYMDFSNIAENVHKIEDVFAEQRALTKDEKRKAGELLNSITGELENIRRINAKFKDFAKVVPVEEKEAGNLSAFITNIQKMANELAESLDKAVEFRVVKEVDTLPMVNKLRNPVIHLVRNALDHGIEDEYERLSSEKKEIALCVLTLTEDENEYQIKVTDNGRGIDFSAIRNHAVELGSLDPDSPYDEKTLLKLLFTPEFSTRDQADDVSGRGVGLDAVQDDVRALGGRISVYTKKGKGTRFTLHIPKKENK